MSIKKELSREGSAVRLLVTIPKEELCAKYNKAVNDIGNKVQVPGFRRGKAPLAVLERKFGAALKEDALNDIVGGAVKGIIEDADFPQEDKPLYFSQPEIDGEFPELNLEDDLKFAVKWEAAPKVEVKEWKGFSAEVPSPSVSAEDIAAELELIRERNSMALDRAENEPAQKGDVITVDYVELDSNDAEIATSRRADFVFTIGTGGSFYQIDDDVIGMKTGDVKTVVKNYEDDKEKNGSLAGRNIKLKITVKAVKEKKLPALDDDLAQDVDEKFETLEDLKTDIRKKFEERLEERLYEQKVGAILDKILEKNPVDVPKSMVEYEVSARIYNFGRQYGYDRDALTRELAKDKSFFKDTMERLRPDVEKQLHRELFQQKLIEEQGFKVDDADREAEYAKNAELSRQTIEEIREYYADDSRRESLDEYIKTKKLFDLLLQENTIKKGAKMNYRDFMAGGKVE